MSFLQDYFDPVILAGHSLNNAGRAVARPATTDPFCLDARSGYFVPQL
jgi:hypothetical protein